MHYRFVLPLLAVVLCPLLGQEFRLGVKVGDFSIKDTSSTVSSTDQLRGRVTVVAFISTKCPISNAFNDRMSAIYRDYSAKGVELLFVNANANETVAEIVAHAKSAAFPFRVFKDSGNELADRFGAMSTPETYVIDRDGVLRYHGYIEDSPNEARAKVRGLRVALDAVLGGRPLDKPETKAFGCSIKRVRRAS